MALDVIHPNPGFEQRWTDDEITQVDKFDTWFVKECSDGR